MKTKTDQLHASQISDNVTDRYDTEKPYLFCDKNTSV